MFKRDGQRAVFVTAEQATATQIKLTIPAKLSQYLSRQTGGTARPTRFRLCDPVRALRPRVHRDEALARGDRGRRRREDPDDRHRQARDPTVIRNTAGAQVTVPVNTDPDCDADGLRNSVDTDDDNDLLPDTLEAT